MSKILLLPAERRECFLLTSPFIEPAWRFLPPRRLLHFAGHSPFVLVAVPTPKGLKLSSRGQGHGVCARRPRMVFRPRCPTPKGSNRAGAIPCLRDREPRHSIFHPRFDSSACGARTYKTMSAPPADLVCTNCNARCQFVGLTKKNAKSQSARRSSRTQEFVEGHLRGFEIPEHQAEYEAARVNGPVDNEQEKNDLCGDLVSFHEDCIHATCHLQYCQGDR